MRNKATYTSPYTGRKTVKPKPNSTPGTTKVNTCKKNSNKRMLITARAYRNYPNLYSQWHEIFNKR